MMMIIIIIRQTTTRTITTNNKTNCFILKIKVIYSVKCFGGWIDGWMITAAKTTTIIIITLFVPFQNKTKYFTFP